MTAICPCCQRPFEGRPDPARIVSETIFAPLQKRVVETLLRDFGRRLPIRQLIDAVYGDRADGGPIAPEVCIHVAMSGARKRLHPHGLTIESPRGKGSSGYRLTWSDAG